jgi:60 kDa SS-A/Ro ribonucleoprotein
MKYAQLFNTKSTRQSMPIPGSGQVPNNAGGFTWTLDPWSVLDRFLILGSEGGTYYVNAHKLTADNIDQILTLMQIDGQRVVQRVAEVSVAGQAPKNDPAILVLALCASMGNDVTRSAALKALPTVCRTGTHLFAFAELCNGLRGWGRGLRRAIGNWYNAKPAAELEYQVIKYGHREGWSNRDLLRLAHPVPASDEHRALYKWVVDDEITGTMPRVEAMLRLRECKTAGEVSKIVREAGLPREAIPTEWLKDPVVWEALLESMPMTAMVRNLATMTRVGLLVPNGEATKKVVQTLTNADRLKRARIHPISLLIALRTYASGRGLRGSGTWSPVKSIIDALDIAFYNSFEFVQPTGRRYLLGVDVSGSMSCGSVAGAMLTPGEAAAAMAMVAVASEDSVTSMAFAHEFRPLNFSRRMRLDQAVAMTQGISFGSTDCSLPMQYAMQHRLPVDVFVVYTDNETWSGSVHPAQALRQYRQTMGIRAKLIVVGMTSTGFTIADPRDPGMLDVVGFDASAPAVMNQFVTG